MILARSFFTFLLLMCLSDTALSAGRAYYPPGAFVPLKDAGWLGEGIGRALLDSAPGVSQQTILIAGAPSALSQVQWSDREKLDAIVDELLRLLSGPNGKEQTADSFAAEVYAAQALGIIDLGSRTDAVAKALFAVLDKPHEGPYGRNRSWPLISLERISSRKTDLRSSVITYLIRALGEKDFDFRMSAAGILCQPRPADPKEIALITATLLKAATDEATQGPILGCLSQIEKSDLIQRDLVGVLAAIADNATTNIGYRLEAAKQLQKVDAADRRLPTLVEPAIAASVARLSAKADPNDINDSNARQGAIQMLSYESANPAVRQQELTALQTIMNNVNEVSFARTVALGVVAHYKLTDQQRDGLIANLRQLLNGTDDPFFRSAAARELGALAPGGATQNIGAYFDSLLKEVNDTSPTATTEVRGGAATALSLFPMSPQQRKEVINALLSGIAKVGSEFDDLTPAAMVALGRLAPKEPTQRNAAENALFDHLTDSANPHVAATALFNFGPINADQILNLFRHMNSDSADRTAFWRANAIAFAGPVKEGSAEWVFLRFLGRPASASIPWNDVKDDPAKAGTYLSYLSQHWSGIRDATAARDLVPESSERILGMVERACPGSGQTSTSRDAWYSQLRHIIADESFASTKWILSMLSDDGFRRCWSREEQQTLIRLQRNLAEANQSTDANRLNQLIQQDRSAPTLGLSLAAYLAWSAPFLLLIALFPRSPRVRYIYLYNDSARNVLSLGWAPILLWAFPGLQRRMLTPFRDKLLVDARLDDFDRNFWFAGSDVMTRDKRAIPLVSAIPRVRGNTLLIGESGLGKSTYLRLLALTADRPTAFLNAHSCEAGVLELISKKSENVHGANLFKAMIQSNDLVVLIDGLNEASAVARAQIVSFANDFPTSDILISTQPLSVNTAFEKAAPYELLPLEEEDIENFLKTRPARDAGTSKVSGTEYDLAVTRLLDTYIKNAPTDEERQAARIILSNPMDLTYASELLAMGELPRPTEMIGHAFKLACDDYEEHVQRAFPTADFAKKSVDLRLEQRNFLYLDECPNEKPYLINRRLLVARDLFGKDGKPEVLSMFRHDKVWDFFMHIAFSKNESLQTDYIDDPKFRGVYLMFAQTADLDTARRLRDQIVLHAAESRDHTLSDEFVRLLHSRAPIESKGKSTRVRPARRRDGRSKG